MSAIVIVGAGQAGVQTAEALRRSDAQEPGAYALTRLLTPLIKFRACRDARKVTADAMEVRGGCGYIEEWGDPRIVRDAHLGSIWEGTSNIVALDVMRAIVREDALPVWRQHMEALMATTPWHPQVRTCLQTLLNQVQTLAEQTAHAKQESMARQAASALYHLTTAIAMGWEAGKTGSMRRMLLAQLVLRHRLLPHNPLQPPQAVDLAPLFDTHASVARLEELQTVNLC